MDFWLILVIFRLPKGPKITLNLSFWVPKSSKNPLFWPKIGQKLAKVIKSGHFLKKTQKITKTPFWGHSKKNNY